MMAYGGYASTTVSRHTFTPSLSLFSSYGDLRDLHSFPTRRSSDLPSPSWPRGSAHGSRGRSLRFQSRRRSCSASPDRKSTRLNSSHTVISYAVFCLKKKKKNEAHASTIKIGHYVSLYHQE